MENTVPSLTTDSSVTCENCRAENASDKKFCSQCRYPIAGTDEEKKEFRKTIATNKILLESTEESIHKARNIIFILAFFSFVVGLIAFFAQEDAATAVVYGFICILYLGLAAWCSKNPFGAILTAFMVYITLQLVSAFVDPASLFSGILWKIIFIGAFIRGIRSASEARGYMKELEKAKVENLGAYI